MFTFHLSHNTLPLATGGLHAPSRESDGIYSSNDLLSLNEISIGKSSFSWLSSDGLGRIASVVTSTLLLIPFLSTKTNPISPKPSSWLFEQLTRIAKYYSSGSAAARAETKNADFKFSPDSLHRDFEALTRLSTIDAVILEGQCEGQACGFNEESVKSFLVAYEKSPGFFMEDYKRVLDVAVNGAHIRVTQETFSDTSGPPMRKLHKRVLHTMMKAVHS